MVKDLLAARRYALALFEIAVEIGQDAEIEAELENLSSAMKKDPSLERFLANPGLKTEDKKKFLSRLYQDGGRGVYLTLLNFFLVLFEKGRFYLIHDIATEFKRVADEAQGQGVAEIRSASALKPEAQKAIVNRLEAIAGHKITVKNIVDPGLIGGVAVKVGNKVIDDTVSNKISMIKKELTKIQSI